MGEGDVELDVVSSRLGECVGGVFFEACDEGCRFCLVGAPDDPLAEVVVVGGVGDVGVEGDVERCLCCLRTSWVTSTSPPSSTE